MSCGGGPPAAAQPKHADAHTEATVGTWHARSPRDGLARAAKKATARACTGVCGVYAGKLID